MPDSLLSARDLPRDPVLPEGDYLFYAGDLSEQKGVGTVLAAYATLDPATRPALVLVGRTAMDLSSLPEGAVVHEKWEHERVLSGFGHALAAVLPSRWPDPCPTTVLEAMALGAPLVTTHMGGIADMVVDRESALVVPPGDVAATAAALTRMVADPELRARLSAQASVEVAALPPERGRRPARGDLRTARHERHVAPGGRWLRAHLDAGNGPWLNARRGRPARAVPQRPFARSERALAHRPAGAPGDAPRAAPR